MTNHHTKNRLFKQRRFRFLLITLFWFSMILGLIIVPVERNAGNQAQIQNAFDGIWWAVSTLTTVGYGDYVPITVTGKIIGIVLQIVGAMMFGLTIAMISSFVNRSQDEFYWNRLFERIDRLEDKVDSINKKSDFVVKEVAEE